MNRHRAILGLAFAFLAPTTAPASDGPSKPKVSPSNLIVETGAKGQVKITRTKQGCEATRITVATLDDGTVRVETNDKIVASADSFRFVVRDDEGWEIALSGHVRVSLGKLRVIFADTMSFYSEDTPISITVPRATTPPR